MIGKKVQFIYHSGRGNTIFAVKEIVQSKSTKNPLIALKIL